MRESELFEQQLRALEAQAARQANEREWWLWQVDKLQLQVSLAILRRLEESA